MGKGKDTHLCFGVELTLFRPARLIPVAAPDALLEDNLTVLHPAASLARQVVRAAVKRLVKLPFDEIDLELNEVGLDELEDFVWDPLEDSRPLARYESASEAAKAQ